MHKILLTPLICITTITLILALLLASPALAQDSSALINEALDKQVKLEVKDTLPQAIDQIRDQTGVPLHVAPEVYDLLPWGDQTNITAHIENQTLREALSAMTSKLGLTFEMRDDQVVLVPLPALSRLGRRSTVDELAALDLLASTPLDTSADRMPEKQLAEEIDHKLQEAKSSFAVDNRPGDNIVLDQQVSVPRNATLLDALEAITHQTRATWYPWGKSIVIVMKEEQVGNQLAKLITVHYPGTEVGQVLTELSQKAGVPFEIEPGALQKISPEFRRVKLDLYDASINSALQAICGFTGLSYVVNDKGVYIWNQNNTTPAAAAAARDPIIGMVPLDNGMQLLIPQSQVPSDVREYLHAKQEQEIEKLRQQMHEENFKPTTAPSAPPAPPITVSPPTTQPTTQADEHL
jgi:hypothetical protein